MAIREFYCKDCYCIEDFFDYEEKVCPNCSSLNMEKILSIPLQARHVDKDKWTGIETEKGVPEDVKARSKKATNEDLDNMIAEFGEQIAIEQGWLIYDPVIKKYRKRTDWDTDTLGKTNKSSLRFLDKVRKKKNK